MLIAYTTVSKEGDAVALAEGLIAKKLAVCVQVDGPVRSHFSWEGKVSWEPEYRLTLKLLPEAADEAAAWVKTHHPYETPEWIMVKAEHVAEKYLSWARAVRNS